MCRNERGFTAVEALVSIGMILGITTVILPQMFNMLLNLEEQKVNMTASHLLNEQIQHFMVKGEIINVETTVGDITYIITVNNNTNHNWKACITYDSKKRCVAEKVDPTWIYND